MSLIPFAPFSFQLSAFRVSAFRLSPLLDRPVEWLWLPIAIRHRGPNHQTCFATAMAIELFGKPLEPFPAFLGAGALALHFHIRFEILPCHPRHTPDKIIRN